MKEYMSLGSSPCGEDCAQVGSPNYSTVALYEMEIYKKQLNRNFPEAESKGCRFKIKWNSHDFGTYGEVNVYWNTDNEVADEYVYEIEKNLPEYWDDESIKELDELKEVSK